MGRPRNDRSPEWAALVRARRLAQGWTQEELVERLGRDSVRYIQRIENQHIVPPAADRIRLEAELKIDALESESLRIRHREGIPIPQTSEVVAPQHLLSPFETMLVAHRIQHADEPEFEQFLQIFADELQDQIDDTTEDLETYLQNAKGYAERDPPCDDIYLAAKFAEDRQLKGVVAAILYAAYYPTLEFVLISCVALNVRLYEQLQLGGYYAAATEIRFKAINLLLRSLKNIVREDVGVVVEVNEDRRAEYKKTLFASYASRLFNSPLYEINLPFGYPFDLGDEVQPAYLLYVPSRRQRDAMSKKGEYLTRDDTIRLLDFLYNYEYGEYYKNIGQGNLFFEKVRGLFVHLRRELPPLIPLMPLRSRALLRLNERSTAQSSPPPLPFSAHTVSSTAPGPHLVAPHIATRPRRVSRPRTAPHAPRRRRCARRPGQC